MESWLIALIAVVPGLLWLYYFYKKDRYEPEPLAWILVVFTLGALDTIPVGIFEGILEAATGSILAAILIAPACEELAKYWVVKKSVYGSREFNEPVDGIIYAAAAGLGFATLENILYVFSAYDESLLLAIETGVLRGLLSVPGHVLFSAMWGVALGMAKFMPGDSGKMLIWKGIFFSMLAHALFNYLILQSVLGMGLLVLVVIPVFWILTDRNIRQALSLSFLK
jgi:RsiW-degrading membrane proteinase PrsW (M82 family)